MNNINHNDNLYFFDFSFEFNEFNFIMNYQVEGV